MRINKFLAASAVVITVGVAPMLPATAGAESPQAAVSLSAIRIDNFGRINTAFYRGGQPAGRDFEDLAALGIKTVIDLQADGTNHDEAQLVEAQGMRFYRIPMTTRAPPTPEQLATFLEIVTDPARQPIYVHCLGGRHRTGVMTAVYRMESDGWTADQAFREMKQYQFGLDFLHPEFKKFVYAYHRRTDTPAALQAGASASAR